MNVGELKKFLEQYPDELEVVDDRYSDCFIIDRNSFSLIKGVDQGSYVMRAHPTMSADNKAREKTYLLIRGA
jgi:hypothetical protein